MRMPLQNSLWVVINDPWWLKWVCAGIAIFIVLFVCWLAVRSHAANAECVSRGFHEAGYIRDFGFVCVSVDGTMTKMRL
jgi:hypothetical protein